MSAPTPIQQQGLQPPQSPPAPEPGNGKSRDRELWIQAKHEYEVALARAVAIWTANHPPETLNAITATLLIHFNRLRENDERKEEKAREKAVRAEQRAQAPQPGPGGPQKGKPQGAQYTGPVPECPWCQGEMWDNRTTKKSPAMPDFKCKQQYQPCLDAEGRPHGLWIDQKTGNLRLPKVEVTNGA